MLNRRELLSVLLGSSAATLAGCSRSTLPSTGNLFAPNHVIGHQIRDKRVWPAANSAPKNVDVLIVGGGIAGLSAAWRLQKSGLEDFTVLELDGAAGGTARSGKRGTFAYPWGAHYLPTPMAENQAIIELLDEMGVVESLLDDGTPIIAEQHLCREPEERVFVDGVWHEGLYPFAGASDEDTSQLEKFTSEIDRWVQRRDDKGKRMFAIPAAGGSADSQVMSLDQETMAQWMDRQGFTSSRLRWLVDYSCRDDFGLSINQTSAWAGLFYFASRVRNPSDESQGVITWPEGNGRIVNHLAKSCGDRLLSNHAVTEIASDPSGAVVTALDIETNRTVRFRAKRVVFAAPQFLAQHLIPDLTPERIAGAKRFQYGSWVVANVHLSDRPEESGFQMCWDNVIFGSKSLGYVTSTHQTGIDHGPTVLTWYYPMVDIDPRLSRKELLSLDWADWADVVLADLEVPHRNIRSLVTQLDIMRWGHAMIQPQVGFVSSDARQQAATPHGPVHFAGTDLSGIALMEEAFFHGVRSAEEVLSMIGKQVTSVL